MLGKGRSYESEEGEDAAEERRAGSESGSSYCEGQCRNLRLSIVILDFTFV